MPALIAPLEEARENLRVIRQTMERSTKYSTLSGLSGVLIGLAAIVSVILTSRVLHGRADLHQPVQSAYPSLGLLWLATLAVAVGIEFACNKRRARFIGKRVASPLGAHIIVAALPAFVAVLALTAFFALHGLAAFVWGIWMLAYGLAICAVGLFSVRPVSYLGAAFVVAGAATLLLPVQFGVFMMGLTFGGFHIVYGVLMGRKHGW
ncbi:hypothetical protein MMC19_007773 [Ptychographa xylographoides]|nr:hypothetical protein [Ptychographa xylographoides]